MSVPKVDRANCTVVPLESPDVEADKENLLKRCTPEPFGLEPAVERGLKL